MNFYSIANNICHTASNLVWGDYELKAKFKIARDDLNRFQPQDEREINVKKNLEHILDLLEKSKDSYAGHSLDSMRIIATINPNQIEYVKKDLEFIGLKFRQMPQKPQCASITVSWNQLFILKGFNWLSAVELVQIIYIAQL